MSVEQRSHRGVVPCITGYELPAPSTRVWGGWAQRAWTLLSASYDEVRAAGRYLFRHQLAVDALYPSLVSATRDSPSPNSGEEPAGSEEEDMSAAEPEEDDDQNDDGDETPEEA